MPKPRANAQEIQVRVNTAAEILSAGSNYHQATQALMNKYNVKMRTAQWYIQRAREEIFQPELEMKRDELRSLHIAALKRLLLKAEKGGDLRLILKIWESLGSIYGVNAPVEHNIRAGVAIEHMPDDQLDSMLADLEESYDGNGKRSN